MQQQKGKAGGCDIKKWVISSGLIMGTTFGGITCALSAEEGAGVPPPRPTLQLAPIRFALQNRGEIAYILRRSGNDKVTVSDQSASLIYTANLQAYSFLWQPWLARVNGGIGFDVMTSRSSTTESSSNKSTALGGSVNASLSLIPKSRTPFMASVYRRTGRQLNGLNAMDSNYQSTYANLSQSYTSRNGVTSGQLNYTRSLNEDSRSGQSKKDFVNFGMRHRPFAFHSLSFDASLTKESRPSQRLQSLIDSVISSYAWTPGTTISASGTFNIYKSNYRQLMTNPASESISLSQQLSALTSWRPLDSSLTLTGSARLYRLATSDSNSVLTQKNDTSSLYLNAYYVLSKGIKMLGTVSFTDTLGRQAISTTMSISATKSFSEIEKLDSFIYRRYVSGSLTNQNQTSADNTQAGGIPSGNRNIQSVTLSAGHSITNNTPLFGSLLVSNVNQSVASSVSTGAASNASSSSRLTTNGSMSWLYNDQTKRGQTSVRVNASDARNITSNGSPPVQIVNAQLLRNEVLAREQTLIGNLTLQAYRMGASAASAGNRSANSNGSISYRDARAFKITGLVFLSALRLDSVYLTSGEVESTRSWENNLSYAIGRLTLKLETRLSRVNKNKQSWLVFTARRSF